MLSAATLVKMAGLVAIAVLLFKYVQWQQKSNQRRIAFWREGLERAFYAIGERSSGKPAVLDPFTATVVEDREEIFYQNDAAAGLSLTRFVRTPAGEYFMFMHNTEREKPYIKHVSHTIARVALREKYVPPAVVSQAADLGHDGNSV
jgi:hypothetical protein